MSGKQTAKHLLFTLLLISVSINAFAEKKALLIAVSQYPTNPKWELDGPKNDVSLLLPILQRRGFEPQNIQVIADQSGDAPLPTRENILSGIDSLASNAKRDDFVFLYMAGHGSQQPSPEGQDNSIREKDGRDEIFLPRDIGKWNGSSGGVENAIVDDEIARRVRAIREKGAFVWVVMDNCHSGGAATRGAMRMREVKMEDLGIPNEVIPAVVRTRGGTVQEELLDGASAESSLPGGYVAFYASQPHQTTPEMKLPLGSKDAEYYGLFSHSLITALESQPNTDYRSLARNIVSQYRTQNWYGSSPLFEGGLYLDEGIFGDSVSGVSYTTAVKENGSDVFSLNWGRVHGLSQGSILAVYANETEEQPLGYIEVTVPEPVTAQAKTIEYEGKPADFSIPDVAALIAKRVSEPFDLMISVHDATNMGFAKKVEGLANINWVGRDNAHYVLSYDKVLDRSALYLYSTNDADDLEELFDRLDAEPNADLWRPAIIQRVENGLRLNPAQLQQKVQQLLTMLVRQRSLLMLTNGTGALADVSLSVFKVEDGKRLSNGADPRFTPGDLIDVEITNSSNQAVNASLLFIGADLSISVIFPIDGQDNKLNPSQTAVIDLNINSSSVGRESFILLTEKSTELPASSFAFLSQAGADTKTRATSAGLAAELQSLFSRSRGVDHPKSSDGSSGVSVFHFMTASDEK